MSKKMSKTYKVIASIVSVPVLITTKRHWYGIENLPKEGGFLVVANHVTDLDSLTFMHYLVANGIPARIMAKAELFKVPLLKQALKITGQIPVNRVKNKNSSLVLDAAKTALLDGECIALFPEGTLTHDPDLWPMKAKTGVARLALETKVPVVPVAQWGAHKILDHDNKNFRPFPRKDVTVVAGEPVYLADLYGQQNDAQSINIACNRIMRAITDLLTDIRDGQPPEEFFDPKVTGTLVKRKKHKVPLKKRILRAFRPRKSK
ncbi:1-acyl-sn-glycerol-3-phosphate acyltransferase [Actinomyces sp. zg-332]|uniref:lysophospholipid acyltransferase family protein n=1 Tax=Actinomyces sp. zg-332 TaxID=2708340 RepID=UPI00142176E2|nr:lysophospholipid acyltransferase family protein [Actinomyces sp. zg-332]QPK93885.1 1-acyl-sn-glycerol-3-phosphate acyltransferase [Actinomyces sp. zg-332]